MRLDDTCNTLGVKNHILTFISWIQKVRPGKETFEMEKKWWEAEISWTSSIRVILITTWKPWVELLILLWLKGGKNQFSAHNSLNIGLNKHIQENKMKVHRMFYKICFLHFTPISDTNATKWRRNMPPSTHTIIIIRIRLHFPRVSVVAY